MTETKFIAHYGYIFRNFFLIPSILIGVLLMMMTPFGDLYYQKNTITTLSIINIFSLVTLLVFLPFFIKNKASLILNKNQIIINYPFSINKKIFIAWNNISSIEKDNKNKVIYIITKNKDIYALDQNLWYRSSDNSALTNPSLEESDLYQAFNHHFSIFESKNIDYNTYKNNFSTFYGNNFTIIFILPQLV